MIKDSLYFVYDNINSRDMGLININYSITGGLVEEPFLANREVLEINTYNKEKPFFQDIKTYPLMINLEFAFENGFSSERLQEVKRWFSVSYFKELYFSSEPNKRYYAILVDDSFLLHNSMGEGLVTATFRCNASWAFSPTYETEIYDFSVNPFQKEYSTKTDWEEGELIGLVATDDDTLEISDFYSFEYTRNSVAYNPETRDEIPIDQPIFVDFIDDTKGSLMCEGTENLISEEKSQNFTGEETVNLDSGTYTISNHGDTGSVQIIIPQTLFLLPFFPVFNHTKKIHPGEHFTFTLNKPMNIVIKELM